MAVDTRSTSIPLPERDPCPFCEYVERGVTTRGTRVAVVADRKLTLSFVDPAPVQPGHVLVIPKRHAPTLLDLEADEASEVIEHARRIMGALVRALAAEGVNAYQNNGVAAGQSVPHYHMHVVPRRDGDNVTFAPEHARPRYPEADRFAMAERIRGALAELAESRGW